MVAQKLFAKPWKEVAIIVYNEQKSGLSEHGKPLFLENGPLLIPPKWGKDFGTGMKGVLAL